MLGAIYRALETGPIVDELRDRILEELDSECEASTQRAFAELYADHPFLHVPSVHDRHSTGRVLTTDYAPGHDFERLASHPSGPFAG